MTKISNSTDLENWENSFSGTPIKKAVVSGTSPVSLKAPTAYQTIITPDEVQKSIQKTLNELIPEPAPPTPHDTSGSWRQTKVMAKEATQDDVLRELNTNLIRLDKRPPYRPPAIKLREANLGGYGNFGVITGQLKSGKSHVIAAMVAAYLSDKITPLGFECKPDATRPDVLYFDTEMDLDDCWLQLSRISHFKTLYGAQFSGAIHMYHLRAYAPPERLKMINSAIIEHHQRCGLVVIDGIRDLMYDINSTNETTEIISDLMRWTAAYNIHMITALHQNKTINGGTNNMRGHIGTEIGNKANYVLECKKEGSGLDACFTLDIPISRKSGGIEPIGWKVETYDIESGGHGTIPVLMNQSDYQLMIKSQSGNKKRHTESMPSEFPDEAHQELIDKIFGDTPALKYSDITDKLRNEYFKRTGKELSMAKARLFFAYWRQDLRLIKHTGTLNTKTCEWIKI